MLKTCKNLTDFREGTQMTPAASAKTLYGRMGMVENWKAILGATWPK